MKVLEMKHWCVMKVVFVDGRTGEEDVDEAYATGVNRTGSTEGGSR